MTISSHWVCSFSIVSFLLPIPQIPFPICAVLLVCCDFCVLTQVLAYTAVSSSDFVSSANLPTNTRSPHTNIGSKISALSGDGVMINCAYICHLGWGGEGGGRGGGVRSSTWFADRSYDLIKDAQAALESDTRHRILPIVSEREVKHISQHVWAKDLR